MSNQLLKSISVGNLTEYFEYLDRLRESGVTNMYGAVSYLIRVYPGMTKQEARAVLVAWMESFSNSLPPGDRVAKALEG